MLQISRLRPGRSLVTTRLVVPRGDEADVKLSHLFGDNMVSNRVTALPVWGLADPGEKATAKSTAKKPRPPPNTRQWAVRLETMTATDKPLELVGRGQDTLTFKNLLVGEVGIARGQ